MNAQTLPPYLRGYLEIMEHLISAYDMRSEDADILRRRVGELITLADQAERKYQKVLGQLDAIRSKGAA